VSAASPLLPRGNATVTFATVTLADSLILSNRAGKEVSKRTVRDLSSSYCLFRVRPHHLWPPISCVSIQGGAVSFNSRAPLRIVGCRVSNNTAEVRCGT
jgi:hypothetical protein